MDASRATAASSTVIFPVVIVVAASCVVHDENRKRYRAVRDRCGKRIHASLDQEESCCCYNSSAIKLTFHVGSIKERSAKDDSGETNEGGGSFLSSDSNRAAAIAGSYWPSLSSWLSFWFPTVVVTANTIFRTIESRL